MRADLESGRDSLCDRPNFLVASVEIPTLNVAHVPLDPASDRRFYILSLRARELAIKVPNVLAGSTVDGLKHPCFLGQ